MERGRQRPAKIDDCRARKRVQNPAYGLLTKRPAGKAPAGLSACRQSVDTLKGKIRKSFLILHGLNVRGDSRPPAQSPHACRNLVF